MCIKRTFWNNWILFLSIYVILKIVSLTLIEVLTVTPNARAVNICTTSTTSRNHNLTSQNNNITNIVEIVETVKT